MRQIEIAFQEFIDAVQSASDPASFRTVAERATAKLGFRWFAYLGFKDEAQVLISSYPKEWTTRYFDAEYEKIDPVIARARHERDLFLWSGQEASRRRASPQTRFFGEAASFGIESGVTVPIRAGFDRFAAFTLAADQHGPDFQERLQRGKDILQLIGLYFHTHVEAALKPSAFSDQPSELSQREAQCLAWAARGRTMDQTGQILEIKPRTVAFHLDNARNKLEAENVTHTVALALKRGIIP